MANINGTNGNDTITSSISSSGVVGGFSTTGDDSINAGNGNDFVEAGDGNDTLIGLGGNDTLNGGDGNDFLSINGLGTDSIIGGSGTDTLSANYATATSGITMTYDVVTGNGTVLGGNVNTTFSGIESFSVNGSNFSDVLLGGAGNDTLIGRTGSDTLDGGDGNDSLSVNGKGTDVIIGGSGTDTLSADYTTATGGVTMTYNVVTGNGTVTGGSVNTTFSGIEAVSLNGSNFNDSLLGGSNNDVLNGAAGNDTLNGGDGNDTLSSNTDGGDLLQGGLGNDLYNLNINNAGGTRIQDADGIDVLNTNGVSLTLGLDEGSTGLARDNNNLIIDINQDGVANGADLVIENFFANNGTTVGAGFIETVGNLSGGDIFDALGAFNTAPTLSNITRFSNEDNVLGFSAADFTGAFSDIDEDSLTQIQIITLPSDGVLQLNDVDVTANQVINVADLGNLTFTPAENFNGTVSFTWNGFDGTTYSNATANVNLTINSVNDAPTGSATAELANGTEDTAYTISAANLLEGFSDVDGDTLSVDGLSVSNGTLVNNEDGTYTFTPAPNFNGLVALSYNVIDGNGGSIAATQSFNIGAVNDAPTGSATAELANGTEDTSYTISAANLLAGFSDVDGDILSVDGLTANNGTLVNNGNGTYTFTPATNFNGLVTLSYNVIDGNGGSVTANQSFNIGAVNDAPVGEATATLINGTEDISYTISAAALLEGFSDVDGDTLSVAGLSASNGTLVDNEDGTYTFTPAANFNGTIQLNYNVIDGNGGSVTATQSFNIDAVNDAPVGDATATLINGTEDTAYTISAADLLAGFSDVDGDTLSVDELSASNGTLVNNEDGTYTFTPAANFNGLVALSYNVIDGNGGSVTATQSFNIDAVNDAPTGTATATLANGTEDTSYTISAANLLAGFSDVDGDTLSVNGLSANNGTLVNNGNGTYTFTPAPNFNGLVTLSYNVIDGNGGSVAATQSFNIDAVNDAPTGTATATLANGTEDTSYTISAANLLAGFSDVDGDTLSVNGLSANNGTLVNNGNGTYTFTPAANFNGLVTLSYNVIDGNGGSVAATQSFNIDAVNDAPTGSATATLVAGNSNTSYTINTSDLLIGFSDVDDDTLSVANLTANNGTLTNNNNGTYTFIPNLNFSGTVSLTYNVIDGQGGIIGANQSFVLDFVNNVFNGNNGADSVALTFDRDIINTAGNNDIVSGAFANLFQLDTLQGGGGVDTLSITGGLATDALNINLTNANSQLTNIPGTVVQGFETFDFTTFAGTTTFLGNNGNNTLLSGAGNDSINGGAGNDTINGGTGNDTIDGGTGVADVVTYAGNTSVTVNLATGIATGVGTDTITNVENVVGSNLGDTLIGNGSDNVLSGVNGNDNLAGGLGNDTLNGGTGNDTLTYGAATGGVVVNLGTGLASGADGLDAISGFESVIGSNFADSLTGSSINETLSGETGNDTLFGASGNDVLLGGSGNDSLSGGDGSDFLTGANFDTFGVGEIDTLQGGAGTDRFILGYNDGNGQGTFYNDGNNASAGLGDYALITDFTVGTDKIQLKNGLVYKLGSALSATGINGTGIFIDNDGVAGLSSNDELIGVIQGVTLTGAVNGTNGFALV